MKYFDLNNITDIYNNTGTAIQRMYNSSGDIIWEKHTAGLTTFIYDYPGYLHSCYRQALSLYPGTNKIGIVCIGRYAETDNQINSLLNILDINRFGVIGSDELIRFGHVNPIGKKPANLNLLWVSNPGINATTDISISLYQKDILVNPFDNPYFNIKGTGIELTVDLDTLITRGGLENIPPIIHLVIRTPAALSEYQPIYMYYQFDTDNHIVLNQNPVMLYIDYNTGSLTEFEYQIGDVADWNGWLNSNYTLEYQKYNY